MKTYLMLFLIKINSTAFFSFFWLFVISFSITDFAQITITSNDISTIFTAGYSTTVHDFDGNATVDIGSTGGNNNWDFTTLQENLTYDLKSIDKSDAPHSGEFPGADFVTFQNAANDTGRLNMWSFYSLDSYLGSLGSVGVQSSLPEDTTILKDNPVRIEIKLPMSYDSSWTQTYTQTISAGGLQAGQYTVLRTVVVDAYGTMTLPGGYSFEALRLRETMSVSLPGVPISNSSVSYFFISKEGAQVTLDGPNNIDLSSSGVVNVENYSWNLPSAKSTAVNNKYLTNKPGVFFLYQNYPNPFNPSTKISYSLSNSSYVTLNVYNVLGQKVAVLVDEEKSAGNYEVTFEAKNLSSGVYFYKLQAGNSVQTEKMILSK